MSTQSTPSVYSSRLERSATSCRPTRSGVISRISTAGLPRCDGVLGQQPAGRPAGPGFRGQLGERLWVQSVEPAQDGGVAVEVLCREVDPGLGGDQRRLGPLV